MERVIPMVEAKPLERTLAIVKNRVRPWCEGHYGDMNMYVTTDLYLTAYLVARGNRLDSFERNNGKTTFRVSEKDGLEEAIQEYFADRGLVSGLRMSNAVKNLKNFLHTNTDYNGKNEHTNNSGATR